MINKSLFICYSTTNYQKVTDIFIESLNEIKVKNINHLLEEPCKTLLDQTGFRTKIWYYSVTNKIKHLIDTLINNKTDGIEYFIFTDCDVIFFSKNINEWLNLEYFIKENDKDIFFMRENISNDVNSGFFIIKNNSNIYDIINFFNKVYYELQNTRIEEMRLGDQTIINNLKNEINYDYIPNEYTIFGENIFDKNKSLFHHAVCCMDTDDKIKQINVIKTLLFE